MLVAPYSFDLFLLSWSPTTPRSCNVQEHIFSTDMAASLLDEWMDWRHTAVLEELYDSSLFQNTTLIVLMSLLLLTIIIASTEIVNNIATKPTGLNVWKYAGITGFGCAESF